MVFVDNRSGSKELIAPLRKLGLPVDETRLASGDLAFEGRGELGAVVNIGIEFKKLEELVQALRTERLQGHQLIGMRPMFDYSYLFIEGEVNYDRKGLLQMPQTRKWGRHGMADPMPGRMTISELYKRVNVLHLCGGLNPQWTVTRSDTLQAIHALYHTWTDQDLDQHKSHLAIYTAPTLVPVSPLRATLMKFPHIGYRTSLVVERHFGTLEKAVTADVEDWAHIVVTSSTGRTKRLGNKVATDIVNFCRGSR